MVNSKTITKTPEEYLCPLSHQLMTDPVVSVHGDTFQRDAILCWLAMDNDCCPFSGNPMSVQDIIPNYALRTRIQSWMDENGISGEQEGDGCSSSGDDDDEEGYDANEFLRKLGIPEDMIEIDSKAFKEQRKSLSFVVVVGEPPIKEISVSSCSSSASSSSSSSKARRFGRLRKALQKLSAKAA
mmetsp:Transcript_129807/g.193253  ORF Transcript_129807/g.193253 Transcript_129807/m.193253 type:complete len:184 (-) Transcript_129807:40-591(-)|eukprot:CAMPEP_0117042538 /NCGR_PEP_ID=MMETSP0472-20121206/29618_1 /TAXON_ID=693140 ORGANISM="Tiarina fusus, Strain LIS" /NCGR_SAMPLE_ID=MMETSP0472 /ASSEMBLY_ACC=CAM_ASM_000603 /LENGTH=183 /DNA_ID=CAMNT_0004753807 /DNA_START=58 /DNA_END=609 /DNA_ORIENTATION=+